MSGSEAELRRRAMESMLKTRMAESGSSPADAGRKGGGKKGDGDGKGESKGLAAKQNGPLLAPADQPPALRAPMLTVGVLQRAMMVMSRMGRLMTACKSTRQRCRPRGTAVTCTDPRTEVALAPPRMARPLQGRSPKSQSGRRTTARRRTRAPRRHGRRRRRQARRRASGRRTRLRPRRQARPRRSRAPKWRTTCSARRQARFAAAARAPPLHSCAPFRAPRPPMRAHSASLQGELACLRAVLGAGGLQL